MRSLALLSWLLLAFLVGCGNTNPGNHTPEEIGRAKPKPPPPSSDAPVPATTPAQASTAVQTGAELFARNCAICHRDGTNGAPPLAGIMGRREFPSGTPANDGRLRDTIKMGRANMPGFANTLSDEQITAIIKHVHTL